MHVYVHILEYCPEKGGHPELFSDIGPRVATLQTFVLQRTWIYLPAILFGIVHELDPCGLTQTTTPPLMLRQITGGDFIH